jgi:hypothetical protein
VGLTAVDVPGVPPVNVQVCDDPYKPVFVKLNEFPVKHWFADWVNVEVGWGLIVIVYVIGVPTQLPMVGVTVIVDVIGLEVVLVAVNAETDPVPLAAKPIAVFELVQAYVAPAGVLVKLWAATEVPAHCETFAGAVITGTAFTTTVVVDEHVVPPFVTVTV